MRLCTWDCTGESPGKTHATRFTGPHCMRLALPSPQEFLTLTALYLSVQTPARKMRTVTRDNLLSQLLPRSPGTYASDTDAQRSPNIRGRPRAGIEPSHASTARTGSQ